jgi:4-diphosphocytidyl-2-C-methyl-D-erythritol kinase
VDKLPERLRVKRQVERAIFKIRPAIPRSPEPGRKEKDRKEQDGEAERIEGGLPGAVQGDSFYMERSVPDKRPMRRANAETQVPVTKRLARPPVAGISCVSTMKLSAPAKINLSLEVRGKRADGFHEIESLMVPITLADTLAIEPGGTGIAFTCSDPGLPADDTNLVVRAAKLFFQRMKIEPGVKIDLEKKIPHGAGLGGGSSDAATTLIALDRIFNTRLGREALAGMAAEIGSDIPFFVYESAAVCRGRGEIVTPVAFPHRLPLLLLKPEFGVPTPWAYQRWRDALELPGVPYTAQPFPWGKLVNDLERPVFEKYLFLAALKRWLLEQPEVAGALMSGSGSTTLAVLREGAQAGGLAQRARARHGGLWTCACSTAG